VRRKSFRQVGEIGDRSSLGINRRIAKGFSKGHTGVRNDKELQNVEQLYSVDPLHSTAFSGSLKAIASAK